MLPVDHDMVNPKETTVSIERLESVRQTRRIASVALHAALRELFDSNAAISEGQLRDVWLANLRESHRTSFKTNVVLTI